MISPETKLLELQIPEIVLYAIKKLIFDDKKLTGEQLMHALLTDFKDMDTVPTGPQIQQICLHVPKYGNDIPDVDNLVSKCLKVCAKNYHSIKIHDMVVDLLAEFSRLQQQRFHQIHRFGLLTGSLPDGREKGASLSDGQSPMRGTDEKGPTAVVRSVSRCKNVILSEGSLFNMKLLPQDLKD